VGTAETDTDAGDALPGLLDVVQFLSRKALFRENDLRAVRERFTIDRGYGTVAAALEELNAEGPLELAYAFRERRLGELELIGGAAVMAPVVEGKKMPEVPNIHGNLAGHRPTARGLEPDTP